VPVLLVGACRLVAFVMELLLMMMRYAVAAWEPPVCSRPVSVSPTVFLLFLMPSHSLTT
jgi:hypothetical protein